MPRKPKTPPPPAETPTDQEKPKATRGKAQRTTMCAHRLPPEAYCSRGCDG